jgi:crotonobetainyl-CoA:carnitine CoA-transferase CaiB-like acyl-CoA transferase
MTVFEQAEVTATPIYEIDQLLEDPHVHARGVLVEAPDDEAGSILMHNIIPRLSQTPGRLRTQAPTLGQHTRSILESIGYTEDRLAHLSATGVIKEN